MNNIEESNKHHAEDLRFVKDKLAVVTGTYLGSVIVQPSNFDFLAEVLLNALRIRNMDITDNNFYRIFNMFIETYFPKPKINKKQQ